MAAPWFVSLRQIRDATDLSRASLAGRVGVSPQTIKAYELGLRKPTRPLLLAILRGMQVDRHLRNQILEAAGFAAELEPASTSLREPEHTFEEAKAEIERQPWPAFIANEAMQIVYANELLEWLWGVPLSAFKDPVQQNLLAMMSTPSIADPLQNWDELVGTLLSMVKGSFGENAVNPDGGNAYFAAAMTHFLNGEVGYVQRAMRLWQTAEPIINKWRFSYPIIFNDAAIGPIAFQVIVNPVNRRDYLTINDFVPTTGKWWEKVATRWR